MKDWKAPAMQELNVYLTANCGGGNFGGGDANVPETITDYPVDGDDKNKNGNLIS